MVPQLLIYPLAVISITGLYAAWHRIRLGRANGPQNVLRERVTYMLWVTATRS